MQKDNSSRSNSVLLLAGAVALAAGLYLNFMTGAVSSADQLRCETNVKTVYNNSQEALTTLLPKCSEPGMVAMMDAQANNSSAAAAAQAISSANSSDIGSNALSFGLIGIGIGLLIGGLARALRSRKSQ